MIRFISETVDLLISSSCDQLICSSVVQLFSWSVVQVISCSGGRLIGSSGDQLSPLISILFLVSVTLATEYPAPPATCIVLLAWCCEERETRGEMSSVYLESTLCDMLVAGSGDDLGEEEDDERTYVPDGWMLTPVTDFSTCRAF